MIRPPAGGSLFYETGAVLGGNPGQRPFLIPILSGGAPDQTQIKVVFCSGTKTGRVIAEELFEQIRRVSKRVGSKERVGQFLGHIWQESRVRYVILDPDDLRAIEVTGAVPRQDTGRFLYRLLNLSECFLLPYPTMINK